VVWWSGGLWHQIPYDYTVKGLEPVVWWSGGLVVWWSGGLDLVVWWSGFGGLTFFLFF